MHKILLFIGFLFGFSQSLSAQEMNWENAPEPEEGQVMLRLRAYDLDGVHLLPNTSVFVEEIKSRKRHRLQTDSLGLCDLLVPQGARLAMQLREGETYIEMSVPDESLMRFLYDLRLPTEAQRKAWKIHPKGGMVLINAEFYDLRGKPVAGEEFGLERMRRSKKDAASLPILLRTDSSGCAQWLVNAGETYWLHHSHRPQFRQLPTRVALGDQVQVYTVRYTALTVQEREAHAAQLKEAQKLRDVSTAAQEEMRQQLQEEFVEGFRSIDSLQNAAAITRLNYELAAKKIPTKASAPAEINIDHFLSLQEIENYRKDLQSIAEPTKDYFQKQRLELIPTLQYVDSVWQDKIIVMDVTSSMLPYMNQLLLWLALKSSQKEGDAYLFFNDGDGIADFRKVAGSTGGLHQARSYDLASVQHSLMRAHLMGSGGDVAENDLEALLEAQKYSLRDTTTAIILVADALSPVRDLSLLHLLKKPVHIVLCGAISADSRNVFLQLDYIEIARKTGGSILTLEGEIRNLHQMQEGETIRIGEQEYVLRSGEFQPLPK